MNGTVFNIGTTTCGSTMAAFVEHHPRNVIGTFWMPSTHEDYNKLACKWSDYVEEENQPQAMLDDFETLEREPGTWLLHPHDNPFNRKSVSSW
ncbi:hypothetical protein LC593_29040 [Nostoc sp. CHAB 5844]|nr:hypothetical protein [Nostoc sp. CHAB 5844]